MLDQAEGVLLIPVCWQAASYRRDKNSMPPLCQGLETAGACDAAVPTDILMTFVAHSLFEQITIHCPHCPQLFSDEKYLLRAVNLAESSDDHPADKALRRALLSAPGAEFALVPLQDLIGLFVKADMFFCRRRPPAADHMRAAEGGILNPVSAIRNSPID